MMIVPFVLSSYVKGPRWISEPRKVPKYSRAGTLVPVLAVRGFHPSAAPFIRISRKKPSRVSVSISAWGLTWLIIA